MIFDRNDLLDYRIRRIVREELANRKEKTVDAYTPVRGHCPMGCGEALVLGDGGYVTCASLNCPAPDAVSTILEDQETEHLVTVTETDFTVRHPLKERLGRAMEECLLHRDLASRTEPPADNGRYRVSLAGDAWDYERIN